MTTTIIFSVVLLAVLGILIGILLGVAGIAVVIGWYVVLSIVSNQYKLS